jgi:hypothetical protein
VRFALGGPRGATIVGAERKIFENMGSLDRWKWHFQLPRPQALIKKFHASHYMKGLHEVVHRDEQAQGVMGLSHRKWG